MAKKTAKLENGRVSRDSDDLDIISIDKAQTMPKGDCFGVGCSLGPDAREFAAVGRIDGIDILVAVNIGPVVTITGGPRRVRISIERLLPANPAKA